MGWGVYLNTSEVSVYLPRMTVDQAEEEILKLSRTLDRCLDGAERVSEILSKKISEITLDEALEVISYLKDTVQVFNVHYLQYLLGAVMAYREPYTITEKPLKEQL